MANIKDILDEIYSRIDLAEALSELEPTEKEVYYVVLCPFCKQREAYIYKGGHYIKCHRDNKCGQGKSLWDYVQDRGRLSGRGTLEELARLAGYELPNRSENYSYDSNDLKAKKEYFERGALFELIYKRGKELLYSEEGKKAIRYLTEERGYRLDSLRETEWIYWPPAREIKSYLAKEAPMAMEDIKELKLIGYFGDNFRLAFPYRDRRGIITGFLKRALEPKGIQIKTYDKKEHKEIRWDSTPGTKKKDLFNLFQCKGREEIIIVEGYPDALYFHTQGLNNVVAIGQAALSKTHLENLKAYGVKRVIIALDNDDSGRKQTENALKMILRSEIKAFVIDHSKMGAYKDPDELVKEKGIEAFIELVRQAKRAGEWMAETLLKQNDITTSLGKEALIEQSFDFDMKLSESNIREGAVLLETIAEATGEDIDALLAERESIAEKRNRERANKEARELIGRADKLLRDGKTAEALNLMSELLPVVQMKKEKVEIEPYLWETFEEEIRETPPELKTGYENLDKRISIPQEAITLIGGRPSHGKTTFMMNLLLQMIEIYPDKTFLFCSYEETRKQIMLKLLNRVSRKVIDKDHNLAQLKRYIRGGNTSFEEIERGKEQLKSYIDAGRLWVTDKPFYVDELRLAIDKKKDDFKIGAVFVDYIQRVKVKEKFGMRQLAVQHASNEILQIAKEFSLPVILGAQFGRGSGYTEKVRLDNLREAGDLEQDAHLVLWILNQEVGKIQEAKIKKEDTSDRDKIYEYTLDISILKQRDGGVGRDLPFKLNGPLNLITENVKGG